MTQQKTKQLNATISEKLLKELDQLHESTHVPKRRLLESAIRLLLDKHESLSTVYKQGVVDEHFVSIINEEMSKHPKAMKKLAE